jgi:hypothetical protein
MYIWKDLLVIELISIQSDDADEQIESNATNRWIIFGQGEVSDKSWAKWGEELGMERS